MVPVPDRGLADVGTRQPQLRPRLACRATVCGLRRAASTTSLNRFLASWTDQVGCAIDNLVWTRDGRGLFCQVPSLLGSGLL